MVKQKPKIDPQVKAHFQGLAEKWKSTIVARDQVPVFTGGAISKGRMANLDCLGEGPERIRLGRKIVYPVVPLVKWLMARVETIEAREEIAMSTIEMSQELNGETGEGFDGNDTIRDNQTEPESFLDVCLSSKSKPTPLNGKKPGFKHTSTVKHNDRSQRANKTKKINGERNEN